MPSEPIREEVVSIIQQLREHVDYLQELGVEHTEQTLSRNADTSHHSASNSPSGIPGASGVGAESVSPLAPQLPPVQSVAAKTPTPPVPRTRPSAPSAFIENLFGESLPREEERLPDSDETFEQIWESVGECTRCPLCQGRANIVHTDGNKRARLMFVGEAPGADEDSQARPFVGRAGQLLTKIIEAIGLKREDVLIGNVNRCRPPGNRAPTAEEAAMCKPFLLREIAVTRPDVIVVLGNTAMKNLLGTREGITRVRGQFQNYKGIKVMPTFHPAYLLRDPSKKRETWEDLKKVRAYLDSSPDK